LVEHFEEENSYDGWMAMADFGGFIIFLTVLHSIVMLAVGFCLNYDGRYLNSVPDGSQRL